MNMMLPDSHYPHYWLGLNRILEPPNMQLLIFMILLIGLS